MPRLSYRAPKYARHKASGQAVVRINGKLVYLGPWGSKESKDRYKQAVTKWADDQDRQTAAVAVVSQSQPESSTTLVELLAEYLSTTPKSSTSKTASRPAWCRSCAACCGCGRKCSAWSSSATSGRAT